MEHIAIIKRPFSTLLFSGEKTIESRWSKNKIAPYKKIKIGDIVWIKETAKPITYKATVKRVEFYQLNENVFENIYKNYGKEICMDKFDNLESYKQKKYCTLIWFDNLKKVKPIIA
ncbi:MAG: ASCH domain-containing protein, partial [Clostridia bacterium]|nr:ASCH domain-containing protein [Clostridia bacterium]